MTTATAPSRRVTTPGHATAHILPAGTPRAVCGASPRRPATTWSDAPDTLRDCPRCAAAARIAAQIAAWDKPPPRPGIAAMVEYAGQPCPAGECARCGKLYALPARGLCPTCRRQCEDDGTLGDWGVTCADRIAEFTRLRSGGTSIQGSALRIGVDSRTCQRWENKLAAAGQAPWRRT